MERYYSPRDLAEHFGIHAASIYRLIKSKRLPAYKVGGQYRIAERDVVDFLNEASVTERSRHPLFDEGEETESASDDEA